MFLGCMNLFGRQGIFVLVGVVLMLTYVFLKAKISLNLPFLLSLIFAISYSVTVFVFDRTYVLSATLYSFLIPALILFFGAYENKKKFTLWMSASCILGLLTAFFLIVLSTYWHQELIINHDVFNDIWNNQTIARTGISLYEIAFVAFLIATLFCVNKYRTWYTLPLILFFIIACSLFSIVAGNRSFLIVMIFVFFAILILKSFSNEHDKFWTTILILFIFSINALVLIYFLVQNKTIVLPDNLMKIKIIARIFTGDLTTGRTKIWAEFFTKFYKYPFGGLVNDMEQYAHNIFLDIYLMGGVIPFLIFTTFIVFLIIYLSYFLRLDTHSLYEKSVIVCIIVGILGIGMIEPIYIANQNSVTPLVLFFLYLEYCKQTEKLPVKVKQPHEKAAKEKSVKSNEPSRIKEKLYFLKLNLIGKSKISLFSRVSSKQIEGNNKISSKTRFVGSLGRYSSIGKNCCLAADVGRYTHILSNVKITPVESVDSVNRIIIGCNVYIEDNVTIKAGIKIGDGAIIKRGAIVLEDVKPYSIVEGQPAKSIGNRYSVKEKKRINDTQWFNKDVNDITQEDLPSDLDIKLSSNYFYERKEI